MADTGPKKFSMADVKARMGNYASTNFYQVFFTLPSRIGDHVRNKYGVTSSQVQNLIEIACIDTTLPGSSLATHEITNDYSGITERHAYRRQFDGKIDFTFAIDREYTLLRMFEGWMGYIGGESSEEYNREEARQSYRVPFTDEYMSNLNIIKYEKDTFSSTPSKKKTLNYKFINAFPSSINSMPISQGATDLLTMTVTMDYQKYYSSTT